MHQSGELLQFGLLLIGATLCVLRHAGQSSSVAANAQPAPKTLSQVLRLAPWRSEVYYNLGVVLEQQKRYAEAARNLKLYLLAAPNASDAAAVQQKIYELEYKAGAR